jgi:hypothetical protein
VTSDIDIVERLRKDATKDLSRKISAYSAAHAMDDAADEIERLRAEIERLNFTAQQNERRVRIGLAVELCAQGSSDERVYMPDGRWTSRPDVLLRALLAAGKGVTLRQEDDDDQ